MTPLRLAALILITSSLAGHAQTALWSPPSSGFVHDTLMGTIRPILGFVGAAYLGAPVLDQVTRSSFAPNQQTSIFERDGVMWWARDLRSPDRLEALDRLSSVREARWAANSASAVLMTAEELVWLVQSDTAPLLDARWNLDGEGRWMILAADGGAQRVLLTRDEGEQRTLWLASRQNAPVKLEFLGRPTAAVFLAASDTALVADAASRQIVRLAALNTTPETAALFALSPEAGDPVAMTLSPDGSRAFVADRTAKLIRVLNATTGEAFGELPLEFAPREFTPAAPGRFLLNVRERAAQPLFFLDTANQGQVSFVPAGE
jgi:hypothetical protein